MPVLMATWNGISSLEREEWVYDRHWYEFAYFGGIFMLSWHKWLDITVVV